MSILRVELSAEDHPAIDLEPCGEPALERNVQASAGLQQQMIVGGRLVEDRAAELPPPGRQLHEFDEWTNARRGARTGDDRSGPQRDVDDGRPDIARLDDGCEPWRDPHAPIREPAVQRHQVGRVVRPRVPSGKLPAPYGLRAGAERG